jgi:hypothetical protein
MGNSYKRMLPIIVFPSIGRLVLGSSTKKTGKQRRATATVKVGVITTEAKVR